MRELKERLDAAGAHDILMIAGGSLLPEDIEELGRMGIDGCFPPGTDTADIVSFIEERVAAIRGTQHAEA
jgi:methylmalonyl-CoA mutase C-terminal domain/subunit